jgi:hypothetical protein
VKTTVWAERQKGRAEVKTLHHLEFPLGPKAADHAGDRFLYVFVDLRGDGHDSQPDVYVVPSSKVKAYCGTWAKTVPMVRWHPSVADAAAHKNNWGTIRDLLA